MCYTYNTNCKLSQLLCKTTNGIVTKYLYGHGLISEDKGGVFKTYHFDYRGSTVAITDIDGNITDTFKYDTYGKLISHTGNSFVIFGYNGRDGVVTDKNGLIYMRARYYSPEMRRFINADIIPGEISNAVTLNRFAYANGNPVSFVDPFGLSAEREIEHNYTQAILVCNKIWGEGLPIVGHTQLYLYDEITDTWFLTEYSGDISEVILDKNKAKVNRLNVAPSLDELESNEKTDYVVLTGDFNESYAYINNIIHSSLGGYHLLYNNCSDYTNSVLAEADIDDPLLDEYFKKNANNDDYISIPASDVTKAREIANGNYTSVSEGIYGDDVVNAIVQFFRDAWDVITFWD